MRLDVKGINKSFGLKHVLKDVTFSVDSGRAFGLLGRNGSGKTTTIRIIMDFFGSDSGEVIIDGVKNNKTNLKFGYLPEERGLYPKKIISEQMCYFGELKGMKHKDAETRAKYLLEKLEATEFYKKRLDTLSKGNQQKIQLAVALINDPDIVILDEPFSGLDPINAKILKDLVRELVNEGKTVIFSSHQMANVEEFCDDVCIINYGDIVLTGDLKKIKKSYPRNRIALVPENEDLKSVSSLLSSSPSLKNQIISHEINKNKIIIVLKNEQAKQPLLGELLSSGIRIDSFSVMEPSLEEIFIEKAGDDINA